MENKKERFYSVAQARTKKIIKMLRLLGNCSVRNIYQYDDRQVEQIFTALQIELDTARQRYAQAGGSARKRFSLSESTVPIPDTDSYPHITLRMPNGSSLRAVSYADEGYPAINLYLLDENESTELICFAEFNPEYSPCREVCIGVYQSDQEDTTYYAPYWAERNQEDGNNNDRETEMGKRCNFNCTCDGSDS